MPYIGNSPGTGTRNRFIFTATASQTTFSGADDNGKTLAYSDGDYVDVYLNGICLVPVDDYAATSKTSIVLTVGAAADDTLEVVAYDIATIADTVSKANGGQFDGDVTVNASFTVDNGDIKLDGNYPTNTGNVALGNTALDSLGAGNYNTAVGHNALTANTDGSNTAFGAFSLAAVTTGGDNVAVGREALQANTGDNNTAVGYQAGYSNTTSTASTYIGWYSGHSTTGQYNTFLGAGSGNTVTTGEKNTIVGRFNGNTFLDMRTLSNHVVLSDGDGLARIIHDGDDVWLDTSYRSFSGDDKDVALFKRFNVGNLASGGTPVNENEINRGFAYITGEVGSDNTFRTVIDNIGGTQTGWTAHGAIGASDKTQDQFSFLFGRRGLSGGIEFMNSGGSTIVQMNWTGSVYQLQMKSGSSTYGQGFYLMVRAL